MSVLKLYGICLDSFLKFSFIFAIPGTSIRVFMIQWAGAGSSHVSMWF